MAGTISHERVLALISELSVAERGEPNERASLSSLGIDSLAFAELAEALHAELGVDLENVAVDGSWTVAALLDAIDRAGPSVGRPGLPAALGRFQRAGEAMAGGALRRWFRMDVQGAERVPPRGPVILAMNHESALDIPVAVIACPRPVRFMAKKELFKGPLVSRLLHEFGGFVVDRDRFDVRAVRLALAVVESGGVLGMYPEGTRAPGRLLPFLPGAAWMALRTGAPIVPLALVGTARAFPWNRGPVRALFRSPIPVDRVDDPAKRLEHAERITGRLRSHIAAAVGGG